MQKIKVRKDVAEQITSKLKTPENSIKTAKNDVFNTDFAENLQNQAVKSENKQVTIKLEPNYGQTADGQVYDLSDPTEKFYYDLKTKFDKEDKKDDIEKSHLYSDKYWVAGKGKKGGYWEYIYNKNNRVDKNLKTTNEQPLNVVYDKTQDNFTQSLQILSQAFDYIDSWVQDWGDPKNASKSICKELRGKKICFSDISYEHIAVAGGHSKPNKTKGKSLREPKNLMIHVPYLPIAKKSLEEEGLWTESRYEPLRKQRLDKSVNKMIKGYVYQTLSVELPKGMNHKYVQTTVSKMKYTDNTYSDTVYISVMGIDSIKKSLADELDFLTKGKTTGVRASPYGLGSTRQSFTKNIIPQQNNLSSRKVIKSLTYSGHKLQGRTRLYGMDISIENKKGSYRSGTDKDGHKWRCYMNYDYGYIRGTEGVDSDQVDVYIGNDENAKKVYVIHQNDPVTHKYDEDKCMLCFSSADAAKKAYMKQYDRPGFFGSMTTMTIDEFKSFIFSKKGKMIHKSFDIQITDITENNKQQKLEQFSKALNAIADNRQFVIKHIPADNSTRYENLTVRLMDFDKSKIEKAVHKVALSLDADVLASSKGESFVYESQKEITEKFYKKVTDSARAVYNFVISYFDLPDIRIISKAGELKHKGKILYNPETGLPIKESEWKKFVVELEKFLNRNYSGIGEKIVLSAESLGIILDRLSKTNSLEAIRKMPLSTLKAKRYDVDWISDSIKNMKDKFGDVISRERQARIQIAMDSAAQRVTRVKDDMRNNIQQIIIDGIRDKQSKSVVAQNLFDKCASLNRDMQRIADSEVQMAANSAYCKEEVYNSKPDEKVYFKRFEMMDDNTCKQCKKLNGTIALWSDVPLPDEHIRDPYAKYAIWEGKNEGSCPIGIVHPYCRGSWIRYYPDIE